MGGVRVVSNRLPKIIAELPKASDKAVDDTADAIAGALEPILWKRTGAVVSTTKSTTDGPLSHSTVGVGIVRGRGFYAGFLEFGTRKMAARPIVGPTAHMHEPILVQNMTTEIGRVCR